MGGLWQVRLAADRSCIERIPRCFLRLRFDLSAWASDHPNGGQSTSIRRGAEMHMTAERLDVAQRARNIQEVLGERACSNAGSAIVIPAP